MIRLRPATPADARAIARIHVETWRSTYPGMLPDQTLIDMTVDGKATSWRSSLSRQINASIVLVAEAKDEGPVGFGSVGPQPRARTCPSPARWRRSTCCRTGRTAASAGRCSPPASMPCKRRTSSPRSSGCWPTTRRRFFYERMGGKRAGERDEALWGATLHEIAYGWSAL